LVVGLGNPILGDDGAGWRVVEILDGLLDDPDIAFEQLSVGGISLMEHLIGHRRAVLVDAMSGGDDRVGTVRVRPLEQVVTRNASHLDSSHDAPLTAALAAASALDGQVPEEVVVVSVSIDRADTFRESLSPSVMVAVGPAVDAVLAVLGRWRSAAETDLVAA
jgi:hydrogenase maturation protease